MSGYAGDPIGRRGLLPAGAALLVKPFTEASLLRMVREVLADVPEGGSSQHRRFGGGSS
jgi:hypothetical protein